MSDPAESNPSSITPSKRHLNRNDIDHLLDGLAVGSGRTREVLDAELQILRAADVTGDEHLTFFEAAALHEIDPPRQNHVDDCRFCRSMVETIYVNDIGLEDFERKVRTQIEATPPQRQRSSVAAWSLAAISLIAAGVFGSAYRRQSTELATLRNSQSTEIAMSHSGSAAELAAPAAVEPIAAGIETATPFEMKKVNARASHSLRAPVLLSTGSSDSAEKTSTNAIAAEDLRMLEEMNHRLNQELVATRMQIAASPTDTAAVTPAKAARFREAARHVEYATRLINGGVTTQ